MYNSSVHKLYMIWDVCAVDGDDRDADVMLMMCGPIHRIDAFLYVCCVNMCEFNILSEHNRPQTKNKIKWK